MDSMPDRKRSLFPWTMVLFLTGIVFLNLYFLHQIHADETCGKTLLSSLGDLLPVLGITGLAIFCKNRFFAILSVLTMTMALTVRITNVVSYAALKEPLTYPVYRLLAEHTQHASLAAQFGNWYYVGFTAAALILTGLLLLWCASAVKFAKEEHPRILFLSLIVLLTSLLSGAIQTIRHVPDSRSFCSYLSGLIREGHKDKMRRNRPIRYGRFTDRISPVSQEKLRELGIIPNENGPRQNEPFDFDRIVVIAVESLDLDFIHAYNPQIPETATPFLDRMARTYPSFTNCFTGAQPTSFAFTAMMLSRMDFDDDLRLRSVSLADVLHAKGIETTYIAPTNGDLFDNERDYTMLFRFDHLYFLNALNSRFGVRQETRWGLGDATLFDCAAKILLSADPKKRSVTFISTMDLHNPYIGAKGPFKQPVLNALKATDANLEKFVMRLMKNKRFFTDKTLIVLTADHTATHGANPTNRKTFTPERIPFILISKMPLKGLPETTKYFSQIDLPATLVSMLGLPIPETFMGQDIRTKGDFALSFNSLDRMLELHRSGTKIGLKTAMLPDRQKNSQETALFEWYDSYYGLTE